MTDELLRYYHEELDYVRRVGNEFSKRHAKIARGLCLDQHTCDDPLVGRLIESFAFLTAKIRHQLDGDYAELARSLLSFLYPPALLPIPALSTIQFVPSARLYAQHKIERHTVLDVQTPASAGIHFRTVYPVTLWPLAVEHASLQLTDIFNSSAMRSDGTTACFSITLKTTHTDYHLASDPPQRLRFYIKLPKHYAHRLYYYLFNHVIHIRLCDRVTKQCVTLNSNTVHAVGFEADEALFSDLLQTVSGFSLLTEYSVFQEKFMYFEISGLREAFQHLNSDHVELLLLMDHFSADLASIINSEIILLGCAPIINLFSSQSEPVHINHQHVSYHLRADQRYGYNTTEIVTVSALNGWTQMGDALLLRPVYGLNYADGSSQEAIFWEAVRQPAWQFGDAQAIGDEIQLRFTGETVKSLHQSAWTVCADILCMNRKLPNELTFSSQDVYSIDCLYQPTSIVRPFAENKSREYLLAVMTVMQTGLIDAATDLKSFKNVLFTLNTAHCAELNFIIAQMQHITVQRRSLRFPDTDALSFVQGIHLDIAFGEFEFAQQELYLFGCVLSKFLNQFCPLNSFIELTFSMPQKGCIGRWEPQFK